jgi:hypothetical protein
MSCVHRAWSRLGWSLLIFLGLAAAVACASHPSSHDLGHPPLCTGTSNPAMLAHDKFTLFPMGGTFPFSLKSLYTRMPLAALSAQLFVDRLVWLEALSLSKTHTSRSPSTFLVVLRR